MVMARDQVRASRCEGLDLGAVIIGRLAANSSVRRADAAADD